MERRREIRKVSSKNIAKHKRKQCGKVQGFRQSFATLLIAYRKASVGEVSEKMPI